MSETTAAPMSAAEEHYEVHGDDGRSWTVQAVFNDKDTAIDEAKARFKTAGYIAFRVYYCAYMPLTGEFGHREVFFVGQRRWTEDSRSGLAETGPICRVAEQLYALDAMRAMRRLLRDWLARKGLNPIEILHDPEHLRALEDSGVAYQSAVQRAARTQAGATHGDVQGRIRELYRLGDEVGRLVRGLSRTENFVSLEGDDVDGLAASLAQRENRTFLFRAALVRDMKRCSNSAEKTHRLLDYLGAAAHPSTMDQLDPFVAHFLEDPAVLTEIIGPQKDLGAALMFMTELAAAECSPDLASRPGIATLSRLFTEGRLPQCQEAVIGRMCQMLGSPKPLVAGPLASDILFNRKIARRIAALAAAGIDCGDLKQAFMARCDRQVTSDGIERLLQDVFEPERRVERLLDVEPGIYGEGAKRSLGKYIIPLLTHPAVTKRFGDRDNETIAFMKYLAGVQERVSQSGLEVQQKVEAMKTLDRLCSSVMQDRRILDKLVRRDSDPLDAALLILRLCVEGVFTRGAALEAARRKVITYMRHPATLAVDGTPSADRVNRLKELKKLYRDAGFSAPAQGRVSESAA